MAKPCFVACDFQPVGCQPVDRNDVNGSGSMILFRERRDSVKSIKWISTAALGILAAASAITVHNAQAHDDNWSVGVVVGNPYPPPVTYYAAPPVYYGPPPVTIYRHPQSTRYYGPSAYGQPIYAAPPIYGAPIVSYPPVVPGSIQFSYGNHHGYGYRNYDRGPRGYRNSWGRGHGGHHQR